MSTDSGGGEVSIAKELGFTREALTENAPAIVMMTGMMALGFALGIGIAADLLISGLDLCGTGPASGVSRCYANAVSYVEPPMMMSTVVGTACILGSAAYSLFVERERGGDADE
ncbi:MAG: hypothetical protein ACNS61_05550 [Candidatus Wenzhouxiangella sp. M2_3B_020]